MRTQNLHIGTLEQFIILEIIKDISNAPTFWFFSDGLNLPEGNEIILTTNYSSGFNTSETGLEDHEARRAESTWQEAISYKPRTPLGQKLMRIRERIVASGGRLLSWEEIEYEIAAWRGEIE